MDFLTFWIISQNIISGGDRDSELWFSCHNLPGSSVELNKTPLEIQDWNLSGAKGTGYSAYI